MTKKLGTGGQGATYSCIRKHDNNSFVIKQVCVIPVPALRTVTKPRCNRRPPRMRSGCP